MEIIVRAVLGHLWNAESGCTLLLEGDIGGTVRETIELAFVSAAQVAAVLDILGGGPEPARAG